MMEEELEDFLKKRGLKEDFIEKIKEQKIDCQTLCAMPDNQLQLYIPKLGDVYATKRFCQELFSKQQKYSRKTSLMERLRRKLGTKYNKPDDQDVDDESSDQRRAKLLGNANACKNERKIEIGWCDFNLCSEKYQQVRNKNGGGTREVKVSKYWKAEDILEYGKRLFFPGGVSKKGCESEFEFDLKDFQQLPVDNSMTVEDLYKSTKMRILRFYVFTIKKQPIVNADACDKCLLDVNLPGLKSVLGLDLSSASASINPGGNVPTTSTALCATTTALDASSYSELPSPENSGRTSAQPTSIDFDVSDESLPDTNLSLVCDCSIQSTHGLDNAASSSTYLNPRENMPLSSTASCAKPSVQAISSNLELPSLLRPGGKSTQSPTMQTSDSNLQSDLLTVQVDDEIMFSLCTERYKLLSSGESASVSYNSLPNTATSDAGTLFMDDMDVVFESVSSETCPNLSSEVLIPRTDTLQSAQEHERLDLTLRIHQGNSFAELIKLYQKEDMCLSSCTVKRVLPNGEDERGEGVGLLRDIFTEFWESFYSKCCEGADVKVPILRHDMGEDEWKSVGRVICDGWSTLKYFPVQLAQPVLEDAIFGMITVSLTTTFLNFIPVSERTIIQAAIDNFELVDMNDLLEVLESHECKKLPTAANIQSIIQEIAHKEILQEPKFVIESWRKVFKTNLEMDQNVLCNVFKEKQPTVKKILNALNFPDVMDSNQQITSNYLKRFVKGLDKKGMENFLRFCTGSNLMSETITVEFTKLYGFERCPVAHTCGSILRMPTTYETFSDMREEFENILSSSVCEMSYV